jgi:predicted DNA-binding transcriptional regulator YafY
LFLDPIETYLVAWDKNLERLLTFGISKIASIEAGDNTEQNTYIVDKCRMYIGSAWGKMIRNEAIGISTVSFDTDPYVSQYFASRQLHWKQITLKRPDGGLHIELPVHNPLEIVRFLLRFGKGVTIKGNEEVLSEMKRFLGEMIEFYDC